MKKGFSLIEVVFAIVIIAISMMSIPILLSQSTKSNQYSVIQEAILASATKIDNIRSYFWDSASYDNSNKIIRVLDVSTGDSELNRVTTSLNSNYRKGHIVRNRGRRFFDSILYGTVSPANGNGGIDEFNGKTETIGGSGAYDYKDSAMSINSKVFYISDSVNYSQKNITFTVSTSASTTPSNIKMIELNTTMPSLNQSFIQRAFMCNIGQADLITRTK